MLGDLNPEAVNGMECKESYFTWRKKGDRWYVRLELVQQFKSELVRLREGLIFEKKNIHSNERERERYS